MGPLGSGGEKTGTHLIGPFTSLAFLSRKCGRDPPWMLKNSTSGSGGSENIKKEKRRGNGRADQVRSGPPGCHERL